MRRILLFLFISAPAAAAPTLTLEAGVRVTSAPISARTGNYTDGGGGARFYHLRASSAVYSARSTDGLAINEEGGVRLSSETAPPLDIAVSSINGLAILPLTGGGFGMAYSVIGTTGSFRIYYATSADGLAWANSTGALVDVPGSFAAFPSLVRLQSGDWRLYYIQDFNGGNDPADFRIFSALSTNQGRNFGAPAQVFNARAGHVAATLRSDGLVRLFYTQPDVGVTTDTLVLSALSTDVNGTAFSAEAGTRLSTAAPGGLDHIFATASTDSWRWRLYYEYFQAPPTSATVHSATTFTPDPKTMSPSSVIRSYGPWHFVVTGEFFSNNLAATLARAGQAAIVGFNITRTSDLQIGVDFDTVGKALGLWDLNVFNTDGLSGTLLNAVTLDFESGKVDVVDNLFRPLQGGSARIDVTLFAAGTLAVKLFTVDGSLVNTLFEGEVPEGTYSYNWNGRTSAGSRVASGLYILSATGPKLKSKSKIVVIK